MTWGSSNTPPDRVLDEACRKTALTPVIDISVRRPVNVRPEAMRRQGAWVRKRIMRRWSHVYGRHGAASACHRARRLLARPG